MTKRYLIAVAAHNLGRILRKLCGIGKTKALQGAAALLWLAQLLVREGIVEDWSARARWTAWCVAGPFRPPYAVLR